jgi:MFS family permease
MSDIKHSSSPSQSGVPDNPLEPDEDKIGEVLYYNDDLPESQEDNFLRGSDANLEPIDPAEARRVLWKIDLLIIPLISGSIILSAVDKVIISNAAIYGMMTDTRLTSSMFSWVASIFYFGYLLFEYPSALLIQRLPVAKLLAFTVFLWAFLMGCTAATQNFAGLMAVRFIMGMSEATCNPIATIVTVMWYTKSEQPVRVAFWYNQVGRSLDPLQAITNALGVHQLSSVFSGLVSYGIGHANSALAPWRLLFITLAAFSAHPNMGFPSR